MLRPPLSWSLSLVSAPRVALAVLVLLLVLGAVLGVTWPAGTARLPEPGDAARAGEPHVAAAAPMQTASDSAPSAPERAVPPPPSAFAALPSVPSPVPSPSPTPPQPREVATVPILMYHHVNDLPPSVRDSYLRELTVSSTQFRQQLAFLAARGARTVGLAELLDYLNGGPPLPERPVILTFDDGYEDNYRVAYPLLRQAGLTGTFFVVANLVGKPGYMTWDQLREMQANGMVIESHSLDHVDLRRQPPAELRRQLTESRRILEEQLGRPVRFLNYPAGQYTPEVIAAARAAGYLAAVTVNYHLIQRRDALFELNRVRVSGADTVESLAAKMVPTFWKYPRGRFGQ